MMKRGIPSVLLVSDVFLALARAGAAGYGLDDLPVLVVGHPLGSRPAEEAIALGVEKAEELVQNWELDGSEART